MAEIKGLDKVLKNLNKEIAKIEDRSMRGLLEAALLILYEMDSTPPVIPVDTNNLRASFFTRPYTNIADGSPRLDIGFSASYAVYVHEMIGPTKGGKQINWNRPGSGPKFLEAALNRNMEEILQIIASHARIT